MALRGKLLRRLLTLGGENNEHPKSYGIDNVETIRKHARTIEMLKLELSDTHYETREGLSGN